MTNARVLIAETERPRFSQWFEKGDSCNPCLFHGLCDLPTSIRSLFLQQDNRVLRPSVGAQ